MELTSKLRNLDTYPFHMPGHKRNKKFNIEGSEIDITEIKGFDDLHNPTEIIKKSEEEIAELFGYKKSIISVNGATCCVLASISAVCGKGDEIIIARNCHKSVYNACYINELNVHYIQPEYDEEFGTYTYITQKSLDNVINKFPNSKAVVITTPTYEGIISKVKSPLPLIIDSAHGAHFGFADWLPERQNGDIVIQSLHKTLPSLTQTAVIHINNRKFVSAVKKYMDIFESSSPSYILLNSIDICIDYLKNSKNDFNIYKSRLDKFYREIKKLKNIRIFNNDDITRIVLCAKGYTGIELSKHLRKNGIEPECATLNYVILISTIGDTDEGFDKLLTALKKIENRKDTDRFICKIEIPEKSCISSDVKNAVITPLTECENKICACDIFAYPPGIPIIISGEIISRETLDYINQCINNEVNIITTDNLLPDSLLTKA